MRPRFDYDHNTIDLSRLKKIIVQLDPVNEPSLDTLLERHQQKLIRRAKDEEVPGYLFSLDRGYKCLDCRPSGETMSREMFHWHALTK